MKRRKDFLASYAQTSIDGDLYSTASSAGGGGILHARVEFEPF
nr:MAG TPA: hypothetical protein [Crassvirales sp.]